MAKHKNRLSKTSNEADNLSRKIEGDSNPSPALTRATAQTGYTAEHFKAGDRKASIFTMIVLAAGCAVLGLLYYQTVKNLHSARSNLATVKQQNNNLQSQLKTVQVAGPAAPASPAKTQSQAAVTVKIPELGLQYQDTGQFGDLTWVVDPKGNNIIFASRALLQKELSVKDSNKITCGFGSMPIGVLSKVQKTAVSNDHRWTQDGINSQIKDGTARDLGDYYLVYVGPQAVCDVDIQNDGSSMDDIAPAHTEIPLFLKALQPIK